MSNSKIDFNIKEGQRGAGILAGNDGLFAKVGQGQNDATGDPNIAYKITSEEAAELFFGKNSSLHKSCKLHFTLGGGPLYGVMPTNDVAGSSSAVTSSGDGTGGVKQGNGDLAINGSSVPTADYGYIVHWIKEGGIGSAEFRYSKDNGEEWSGVFTLSGATIVLDGGITLDVTEGTPSTDSFKLNDKYSFTTTAPTYSVTNLETALDVLKTNDDIRMIQVLGAVDIPFLNNFDTLITEMQNLKRWIRGVASIRNQNNGETDSDYINFLITTAQSFYSKNIAVVCEYVDSKVLGEEVSIANHLLATLSKAKVHWSPGWTREFPQEDVLSISHWDILESLVSQLEDEGYTTLYYEDGEASGVFPFFNVGLLKAPSGSDYRKISSGRVMDKALRRVHAAVFPFLRENMNYKNQATGNKAGLLGLKLKMETALDGMKGNDEIGGYEINIPLLDDPNATVAQIAAAILSGTLDGTFKLIENGHIESMTFDASYVLGL